MNAKEKNRLAGIFLLAHGGLTGLIYLLTGVFFGIVFNTNPNQMPGTIFMVTFFLTAIALVIFALPQIIGGWKMYKEDANAKNWGIAGAILACLTGFLGIGAGVYALISLFGNNGKNFYDSLAVVNQLSPANLDEELKYQSYQQTPREPYSWK